MLSSVCRSLLVGCLCLPACDRSGRALVEGNPVAGVGDDFLVVGDVSSVLGVPLPDTVPEVERALVPELVRNAAKDLAQRWRRAPSCTRFFRGDSIVLALLVDQCPTRNLDLLDSEGLVGFHLNGQLVQEAAIISGWTRLCAASRDTLGRAVRDAISGGRCTAAPVEVPDIGRSRT